jgi:heat shock protein HslJ
MSFRRFLLPLLFFSILQADPTSLSDIEGGWHLRVMDGYDVRKVRAIPDFQPRKMRLEGFDACNRISGKLTLLKEGTYRSRLATTRMACRGKQQSFVSRRLHETIEEGFTIHKEHRYGIDGLTIQSKSHTLFFKKMGKASLLHWLP